MTNTITAPIHTATVTLPEPNEDGDTVFYFASLDGERWLPVTRLPLPGEHQAIADLFAGKDSTVVPMTCHRRFIEWHAEKDGSTIDWGEVA